MESILLLFIESGAAFAAIQVSEFLTHFHIISESISQKVLYIVFEVLDLNTGPKSPIHTFSLFVADSYGICSVSLPFKLKNPPFD